MRDGMLVAANGTGHDCLIWAAFAEYGVGEGASSSTKGGGPFGGGNVKVTESFDLPTECTGTPTNNPSTPYSPCNFTATGRIFFLSSRIASTISATLGGFATAMPDARVGRASSGDQSSPVNAATSGRTACA